MPIVSYEYEKSVVVEDEVDIPQSVIDKGDKAIRSYIMNVVWNEGYGVGCMSENEDISFRFD